MPSIGKHLLHDIQTLGGGNVDKVDWNCCDQLDFIYWTFFCDKCNNDFNMHNDYISSHY